MLRYLTAGESHGPGLTVIVEGMPSGVPLSEDEIAADLQRRQQGYGRGGRMKIERDRARIVAGVRGGLTLGSPVALSIENRDWANWERYMAAGPEADLETRLISRPRPGHADLAGAMKYHQRDLRNILERSSARETAARVAAGALARALLRQAGVEVFGHVLQIGPAAVDSSALGNIKPGEIGAAARRSPVFCADRQGEVRLLAAIDEARAAGDSLGGLFEVLAVGLPVGLGSHVQYDRRLDGRLAQALMSIPAIKGVEIGLGFAAAALPGSLVHDEILYGGTGGFYRQTNRAGGLEGGLTNGEILVVRAAMKPIPTLMRPLASVDIESKAPVPAAVERSDVCAVPAASVVGEAAVALVLAQALLEKFGGDHLDDLLPSLARHREYCAGF